MTIVGRKDVNALASSEDVSPLASSKNYKDLDQKITSGGSTLKEIKQKREAIKENITKKVPQEQLDVIHNFGKVLFTMLKDAADTNITSNKYLFELLEDITKKKKLYDGMYKIDVIKRNDKKIICKIQGTNYQTTIEIDNGKIMEKKAPEDKLEDIFTIAKTYKDRASGKIIKKTRPGRKEDFLDEIEYGDSVIIDVQKEKIRRINPDDIIEEIGTYIKKNDNNEVKAKKIQTAMKFFNESQERISSEYIQNFMNKLVKDKEHKWNGMNKEGQIPKENKEHFTEVLKTFLNKQKLFLHKENDIDKSAIKFLLKKFGVKPDKIFHEIDHGETENFDDGIYFDVLWTVNGIKVEEQETIDKNWKKIIKRKKIASEHTDKSDEALLHNRPSSTTQIIFKIFKELWAIKKEESWANNEKESWANNEKELEHIERFVNFVNTVDSMDYQISGIDYKHNYQTVFGLYRAMNIQDVFDYFKDPKHNGFEILPEQYMKKTKANMRNGEHSEKTLQEVSEKHKSRIEKNMNNFDKLQKAGKELAYKHDTKFIVDIEEKTEDQIQDGPQTAGYYGYGFFNIKPQRGNLYMYNPKKMPPMVEWFPTESNGHFLIINTPTVDDIKKLFETFYTPNEELKNSIIKRLESIQARKEEPISNEDITTRCNKMLPVLTTKELKAGKTYTAVINNDIQNKIAYVTLDNWETIRWRIKVADKNELKSYKKGDFVKIKVDQIPEKEGDLVMVSLANAKE